MNYKNLKHIWSLLLCLSMLPSSNAHADIRSWAKGQYHKVVCGSVVTGALFAADYIWDKQKRTNANKYIQNAFSTFKTSYPPFNRLKDLDKKHENEGDHNHTDSINTKTSFPEIPMLFPSGIAKRLKCLQEKLKSRNIVPKHMACMLWFMQEIYVKDPSYHHDTCRDNMCDVYDEICTPTTDDEMTDEQIALTEKNGSMENYAIKCEEKTPAASKIRYKSTRETQGTPSLL